MVFSSYIFLFIFLPLLLAIYYLIPARFRKARNGVLLLFSLVFYAWGKPVYLLLLLGSIALNWLGSLLIGKSQEKGDDIGAKTILIITLALNILLLVVFKYTDFLLETINGILGSQIPLLNIALPIGISFYTFQGLSYTVDVYRKQATALKNPLTVALYISLFPQLVAGPIVRYTDVMEELKDRKENFPDFLLGCRRFAVGLAKKLVLADTLGLLADEAFSPSSLPTGMAWLGALAYMLQIYFDFSGYSDMAIALGRMFGFHFIENFNYPYISGSITEFWRRWHISLSGWFRDYVYIPLGGSRCKLGRQIFNLAVVWSLTGLWHGAAWQYVLWGVYYLLWLLLEKFVLKSVLAKIPQWIRTIPTLLIVLIGWVIFRSDGLEQIGSYLSAMVGVCASGANQIRALQCLRNYGFFLAAGIIGATPLIRNLAKRLENRFGGSLVFTLVECLTVCALMALCVCYIVSSSYNAFIYFQF